MSTIKVDTIATRTGSGNITASNTIAGNLTGNQSGGSVSATTLSATSSGAPLTINSTNSNNLKITFQNAGSAVSYMGGLSNGVVFGNAAGAQIGRLDGDGLKFGTDSASANALDDYEEGQWTPNIYNAARTSNWTTKKGDYIKIGKLVHCWFVCDHGNSNSGSGTGNLILEGMPFSIQVEATSGSTFAHNSTQSVGIWGANPSSQVGNLFSLNAAGQFQLYKGGSNQTAQITFASGAFSYIAQ